MIPKEAIERAIAGGYRQPGWLGPALEREFYEIALDPLFWQALGKALGWDRYQFTPVEFIRKHPSGAVTTEFKTPIDEWHQAALLFCSMILGEKNTDEFWEELLPAK